MLSLVSQRTQMGELGLAKHSRSQFGNAFSFVVLQWDNIRIPELFRVSKSRFGYLSVVRSQSNFRYLIVTKILQGS